MEKRKLQITLKQRIGLCLAAFFAALAMQIALNGYQARAVQAVRPVCGWRWPTAG